MKTISELIQANLMANRLRVTAKWLKAEAEAGRIPHLKADRVFSFDPDAVKAVLLRRAQEESFSKSEAV